MAWFYTERRSQIAGGKGGNPACVPPLKWSWHSTLRCVCHVASPFHVKAPSIAARRARSAAAARHARACETETAVGARHHPHHHASCTRHRAPRARHHAPRARHRARHGRRRRSRLTRARAAAALRRALTQVCRRPPVRVRLRSPMRHRAHHRASRACHRVSSRASSRYAIVVVVTRASLARPGSSHCLVAARGAEHGRGGVSHAAGPWLGWRVSRTAHPSALRLRAARMARTTRPRLLRIMSDCFLRIMYLVTGKIKIGLNSTFSFFSLDATSPVSQRHG